MKPDPVMQERARRRRLLAHQLSMGKQAMQKVASVKPTDEELQQGLAIRRSLEKTAARKMSRFFGDSKLPAPAQMFMAGAMLSAGAMAGGGAGLGVAHAIGKGTELAHKGKQKGQYSAMLKADPTLKREPKARAYFNVLHKASPYIASEPHVAAATVRSMLEAPEGYALHPKFVKDVLDIEEKRQKTRYPAMRVPSIKGELPDLD